MNFFNIGFLEILVILVLALILFGPQRLLNLASSLRKALAEFQQSASNITSALLEKQDDPDAPVDGSTFKEGTEFVPEGEQDRALLNGQNTTPHDSQRSGEETGR